MSPSQHARCASLSGTVRQAGRAISAGMRTMFCIFAAMSSVRSAVLPPAPHVMSQKVGPNDAMRSCLSKRFSTPCESTGELYHKSLQHHANKCWKEFVVSLHDPAGILMQNVPVKYADASVRRPTRMRA